MNVPVTTLVLVAFLEPLGCSGNSGDNSLPQAGATSSAGTSVVPSGGAHIGGQTTATSGGTSATTTGGASATTTGGTSATTTGGTSATTTGGTSATTTGGTTTASGSTTSLGGKQTGGTAANGGTGKGGATANGGTPARGGSSATGGASSAGERATGGSAVGGMAHIGGAGTGGASGALPPLHVDGKGIYDSTDNLVVLRGVATIDIGAKYNWNGISDALQQMKSSIDLVTATGWKTRVVRLPVYGSGSTRAGEANNFPEDGPVTAQDTWFETVLKPVLDYATSKALYAIVDWHEIASATTRDAATKKFWTYMAPKLKNQPNVLYEVFNEDSDTNDWGVWQPLAQGWVNIIRQAGANNVVLVGGPMWAQTIGGSATKPVTGGNVAYVAHIYCSHYNDAWSKGHIETQVAQAAAVAPLFITEWGFASDEKDTAGYLAWMKGFATTYGASWTAWVVSPSWTPAMFNVDRSPTAFGQAVKDWLAAY